MCGSTWFFIEALYLQYQISFGVFGESQLKIKHFIAIGWGIPVIFAVPWIIAIHFRNDYSIVYFFSGELNTARWFSHVISIIWMFLSYSRMNMTGSSPEDDRKSDEKWPEMSHLYKVISKKKKKQVYLSSIVKVSFYQGSPDGSSYSVQAYIEIDW